MNELKIFVKQIRQLRHNRKKQKWSALRPRKYTDDVINPLNKKFSTSPLHLALSSVDDLITSKLLHDRFYSGKNLSLERLYLITDIRLFKNYLYDIQKTNNMQLYVYGEEAGLIVFDNVNIWEYNVDSNTIRLKIAGDTEFVDSWVGRLHDSFSVAECFIEWMYSADGNSANVPVTDEKKPITEMYPFLSNNLFEYYDDYIKSSASVLVLIGPPGTGKTTFIRGLLQHTKTNALVSYDPAILEKDYIFARFIEGSNSVMVLEDADNFLGSRTDGNTVMHKFLNVGDGLISTQGKKMIFSTNLPSIKDIDPALIRPGRCFDVIEFKPLTTKEHNILCDKLNMPRAKDGDLTLAEVFHTQVESKKITKRSMGFY